jgi:hypothetical protein
MLKVSLTAGALAVAMLVAMTVGKAQAALKPEIAKTEGVTLVGPGGGGGFGGGGGGQKFGGFGGGGRGLRGGDCGGRGLSMRAVRGGDFGPKVGPSAAAFRCSTGAVTVPDLCTAARRNFRAFPAEKVQMIVSTANLRTTSSIAVSTSSADLRSTACPTSTPIPAMVATGSIAEPS